MKMNVDGAVSEALAFCANPDESRSGMLLTLRLLCLMVEWSLHGVPWLLVTAYQIISTDDETSKYATGIFAGLVLDLACVGLLKIIFRRPRPSYGKMDMVAPGPGDHFSFPSGHTSRGFMLAFVYIITIKSLHNSHRLMLCVYAIFTALSRVMMGRHYVSDVLFGAVLGLAEGFLVIRFMFVECYQLDNCFIFDNVVAPMRLMLDDLHNMVHSH